MRLRTSILRRVSLGEVSWALFQCRQSTVVAIANCPLLPAVFRASVLRGAGVVTDGPVLVYRDFVIQGRGRLHIGGWSFVNHGCYFDTVADIRIGTRVFIADHVRLLTSSHQVGSSVQRASTLTSKPVEIGDGCWIGSGVVVMPGVTIGAGCIVGANSLVTKDCDPNGLYVGSPARLVDQLAE